MGQAGLFKADIDKGFWSNLEIQCWNPGRISCSNPMIQNPQGEAFISVLLPSRVNDAFWNVSTRSKFHVLS